MNEIPVIRATTAWHVHYCPKCYLDWTCFEQDCRNNEQNKVCFDCQTRMRMKRNALGMKEVKQ